MFSILIKLTHKQFMSFITLNIMFFYDGKYYQHFIKQNKNSNTNLF